MRLTDYICEEILRILTEEGGIAEIGRNDLASRIGCVPSQVSYVITSRFTREQGFLVESRRGGGGFIRISRMEFAGDGMIMHIVNSVGNAIDFQSARVMLENIRHEGQLSENAAGLILAAISDNALRSLRQPWRDEVRAAIFKNTLISQTVDAGE